MCVCPELLETSNFATDAKAKARKILDYTRGFSMGKVLWYIDGQLCVERYLEKVFKLKTGDQNTEIHVQSF